MATPEQPRWLTDEEQQAWISLARALIKVPAALDVVPVLVPVAALGLAAIMLGAIVVHARRKETSNVVVNVVLLALAVFVAWGRFGPHAF